MAEPRPITQGLFVVTADGPRLVGATCAECRRVQFPAAVRCPDCGGSCGETPLGPLARLFLYTVVASAPPGYRGALPYGFGVVELDEGLRVVTRLTEADLGRLSPGLAMRLVVEPLFSDDDGTPVLSYAFAPAT